MKLWCMLKEKSDLGQHCLGSVPCLTEDQEVTKFKSQLSHITFMAIDHETLLYAEGVV